MYWVIKQNTVVCIFVRLKTYKFGLLSWNRGIK
jgi:hypothetical protein